MSQITHVQKAAALVILPGCFTIKEFTDKFNRTYETKHDEWDFTSLIHEFELGGVVKRLCTRTERTDEAIFISVDNQIFGEQVRTLKKAIEVEQSHNRAYHANR